MDQQNPRKHVKSLMSVIVTVFLLEVGECQIYANYFSDCSTQSQGLKSTEPNFFYKLRKFQPDFQLLAD